jgi:signal transduction histidine kinase/ligand-binding sensor domain-containing protein/CheY-like chemotaxis protein
MGAMSSIFPRIATLVLLIGGVADAGASAVEALPENPLFRQFGTAQGLPSATVNKLAQDRDGNLWIGTLDGLARYDGVDFKVWRHDPDNPRSVPANDVEFVMVDEQDSVWVTGHNAGIARYEPHTDDFTRWQHDPAVAGSLPGNRIWAMADDGDGGLWLGGYQTGLVHMSADGVFRSLREPMLAAGCNDIILSLAHGQDQTVWIGTSAGLCRWRRADGFATVEIDEAGSRPVVLGIRLVNGVPWLATSSGLNAPQDRPDLPQPPAHTFESALSIEVEPDGWIWLGTRDGVRRWQPATGATATHLATPGHVMSLPSPRIGDILQDREGSMWFATQAGLAQLVPQWRAIRVYLGGFGDGHGLPPGRPRNVGIGRDGQLWVTSDTNRGVSQLNPADGTVRRWFVDSDGREEPDADSRAVIMDRQERLWLGHRSAVSRYTPATGEYQRFDRDRSGQALPPTVVRRLVELADGRILAAFGGAGIAWIDEHSGMLDFDPLGDADNLPCAQASDIRGAPDGSIWIACEHGVLTAPLATRRFQPVTGAPDKAVHGLAFTADGSVWLHALGHLGEYRVDDGGLTLQRSISAADGWPLVDAGGMAIDDDGVVWVITRRGLQAYDPRSGRIATYDEAHGLPSAEFIDTPPAWLAPGLLATATTAGVVLVDTTRIRAGLPPATLRWHEASVVHDGRRQVLDTGTGRPWSLAHNHRDLRVAARLGSLLKPDAHRYRFRFNDDPWHDQAGQPERLIDHLPSGRHTLEIEALGSDGQPSGNRLRQDIHVGLPPWRQPWALMLYALAAVAVLLVGQHLYRRRLDRQHALTLAEERRRWAEQASAAKTRFLAAVGHELRTPMAGLLGMNELLATTPLDPRQQHFTSSIQRAGNHMLTLVNDLLDLSRIESGQLALTPTDVDLVGCLDELIGDVAANAESKQLVLSLRIEPGTPLGVQVDGKRLHQILLNLLNNAIKFTPDGHIRLRVSWIEGRHSFEVIDNGPGISDDLRSRLFERYSQDEAGRRSGGSGLGLAIARELVELMGGDIGVTSGEGGGSRFWFTVPLQADVEPAAVAADGITVRIIDNDTERGDDLATSLRALGVTVVDNAITTPFVLVAAKASDQLEQRLLALGPFEHAIVSLPLAYATPDLPPAVSVVSGPWPLRTVIKTLSAPPPARSTGSRPASPPTTAGQYALTGRQLLLVEDDPVLGEVMASQLRQRGASVELATDGLAALAAATSGHFDGFILDLDLPEMDGLQVLRLLRHHLVPLPPVAVVTARHQEEDEALCRAAGARAFFRKPVDVGELVAALLTED